MLVLIKGAGDIASGIALRLHRCGFDIVMTETAQPSAIRRTVCFSEAVRCTTARVEDVTARLALSCAEALQVVAAGDIAVLVDPNAECVAALSPKVVVDAILAKRNLNTRITDADIVIAIGPGFHAGADCHAVIESNRGHALGRVILSGAAEANTGVPGDIGGYTVQRVLRAPADGEFTALRSIGDTVHAGDAVASVEGNPVLSEIDGILRGLLPTGQRVRAGMKCGDVDPRCRPEHCYTASDKALSIGGGVLEAILTLGGAIWQAT
ncbi:MAG: selenium-dependent molybdenum cofactor biosynthesis protein YqeB [Clostridia bacterium]|nr:selenium-dependent molybdenum cofactor biosynthesis protein YqeB [Clostridia bacterium]